MCARARVCVRVCVCVCWSMCVSASFHVCMCAFAPSFGDALVVCRRCLPGQGATMSLRLYVFERNFVLDEPCRLGPLRAAASRPRRRIACFACCFAASCLVLQHLEAKPMRDLTCRLPSRYSFCISCVVIVAFEAKQPSRLFVIIILRVTRLRGG